MSIRTDPNALVDKKFVGIPYLKIEDTGKDTGFLGTNCIGICILWMREQGFHYEFTDRKGSNLRHWWVKMPRRFVNAMLKYGKVIRFSDLVRYDVILFFSDKDDTNRFPTHMGIMVDGRNYLTSTPDRGSYVKMLSMEDKKKFFGGIRLHEVTRRFQNG